MMVKRKDILNYTIITPFIILIHNTYIMWFHNYFSWAVIIASLIEGALTGFFVSWIIYKFQTTKRRKEK